MDLLSLLNEIQTIARTGLHFSSDIYDRERYEQLMEIATRNYEELLELPEGEIRARFDRETGYITPKIGADAAIFNDQGEILLMQRSDGSGWCLPCGWVDPNESPAEAVVREVLEETGLEVEVQRLVGLFTRKANAQNGPHTMVAVVHLCEILGGELTLSHEGLDLRYWHIEDMAAWHHNHDTLARAAREMWRADQLIPAISN